MQTPYEELKAISDAVHTDPSKKGWASEMVALLRRHGFKPRADDQPLRWVTISSAEAATPETLVLGLRYDKVNGAFGEDLYLFMKGSRHIQRCDRGRIEAVSSEKENTASKPSISKRAHFGFPSAQI